MRSKSFWIFAPLSIAASALVAYAIVFAIPRYGGYDVYDYIDTFSPRGGTYHDTWTDSYSYDSFVPHEVKELSKRQPQEAQTLVKELWNSMVKTEESALYRLKWLPDVCIEFDCKGLPNTDVKPYIDLAISYKQSSDKTYRELVTLAISITALLVSMIGLFVKRKG